MPAGRPTAYRPKFCETVVELGRQGKSKAQIAAALDVSRLTLDNWAAEHPEFLNAMTHARDLALSWWEDQAQQGLTAERFQASLWSRSMAARFPDDYREKAAVEHSGNVGINWPVAPSKLER